MTMLPVHRTQPATRPVRRSLAGFAMANALAAWSGAVGLIGGGLSFGSRLDQRLPFDSTVLAGVALAASSPFR